MASYGYSLTLDDIIDCEQDGEWFLAEVIDVEDERVKINYLELNRKVWISRKSNKLQPKRTHTCHENELKEIEIKFKPLKYTFKYKDFTDITIVTKNNKRIKYSSIFLMKNSIVFEETLLKDPKNKEIKLDYSYEALKIAFYILDGNIVIEDKEINPIQLIAAYIFGHSYKIEQIKDTIQDFFDENIESYNVKILTSIWLKSRTTITKRINLACATILKRRKKEIIPLLCKGSADKNALVSLCVEDI
jgi:hypothetical protein